MNLVTMTAGITTALMMLAPVQQAQPQDISTAGMPSASAPWRSDRAVYVAGLAEVKPNSAGSLSLTKDKVVFANKKGEQAIPFNRITAVSIGDERVATGGTAGKVARQIQYDGFGTAVGAVTNKRVGLLTIEYLDQDGGHHGAVFEVPKTQALVVQQQLASRTVAPPVIESHPCNNLVIPNAILVEPIVASIVELPAEYRTLLYEQLVNQLQVSNGAGTIYRVGDADAPCAAKKLKLTVTAFKKGNEAVRASTGPVGLFVGVTSVRFDVRLVDNTGTVLFEKSLKASKRGDGDSLNVARNLARNVSKRLAKAEKSDSHTVS